MLRYLDQHVVAARAIVEAVPKGLGPSLAVSRNRGSPLVSAWSWGQSQNCRPRLVDWVASVWWHAWSNFSVWIFTDFIGCWCYWFSQLGVGLGLIFGPSRGLFLFIGCEIGSFLGFSVSLILVCGFWGHFGGISIGSGPSFMGGH